MTGQPSQAVRDTCWTEMRSPMACQRLVHKLLHSHEIDLENDVSAAELGQEARDE